MAQRIRERREAPSVQFEIAALGLELDAFPKPFGQVTHQLFVSRVLLLKRGNAYPDELFVEAAGNMVDSAQLLRAGRPVAPRIQLKLPEPEPQIIGIGGELIEFLSCQPVERSGITRR